MDYKASSKCIIVIYCGSGSSLMRCNRKRGEFEKGGLVAIAPLKNHYFMAVSQRFGGDGPMKGAMNSPMETRAHS
jgi:hypothetical protein